MIIVRSEGGVPSGWSGTALCRVKHENWTHLCCRVRKHSFESSFVTWSDQEKDAKTPNLKVLRAEGDSEISIDMSLSNNKKRPDARVPDRAAAHGQNFTLKPLKYEKIFLN